MAKIKITFNNITKVLDITEEFDTEIRIWNEFAEMATESMFGEIPFEYKNVPIIDFPNDIAKKFFQISEVEKQYEIYEEKMISKLIEFIETNFNSKIHKNSFHWLSTEPKKIDLELGIKHIFDCLDIINKNKLII